MKLTGKEKKEWRSLGKHLKPEIWIGKNGISEGSIHSLENSFRTKELVKVRIQESCDLDKKVIAETLSRRTQSEIIQVVGNTILLYRSLPEE